MRIEEHHWISPRLGRDMGMKVYGHWGQPFIAFPCSCGRYFDYEGMGMVEAIAPFIEGGRIKLYCVDSVDADSWYDFSAPAVERNARHEWFVGYITDEVVPFVRGDGQDEALRIMTTGTSMGAFHAVNFLLRRPDLFAGTIALSGLYRLDRAEFGIGPEDMGEVYLNSPLNYLPNLTDSWYLDRYRGRTIILCAGQGPWEGDAVEDTVAMDRIFREKDIGAWVDLWGHDVNHDWPWWFKQMNYFLGGLYGD